MLCHQAIELAKENRELKDHLAWLMPARRRHAQQGIGREQHDRSQPDLHLPQLSDGTAVLIHVQGRAHGDVHRLGRVHPQEVAAPTMQSPGTYMRGARQQQERRRGALL
jgi:hypothetical protein